MATNFPASVDSLTNPVSNDSLNSPSHSAQHANANDAIEAIETYLLGDGASGFVLVKAQTIGTAVSSVNVTDAFSAKYDNYKIVISGGVSSAAAQISLKMGTTTTGYYSGLTFTSFASASASARINNNAASWLFLGVSSTDIIPFSVELMNPFLSKFTLVNFMYIDVASNGDGGHGSGILRNTTSYTDFTITPSTGTLTGGTIRVYGYKNS